VFYKSSTGHEETYTLPVVVNNGSVEKIIFNENGGCVHVGINHSGYKYYGGDLEYVRDVDAYFTEVTIVTLPAVHVFSSVVYSPVVSVIPEP
jgi:hypothetical protein